MSRVALDTNIIVVARNRDDAQHEVVLKAIQSALDAGSTLFISPVVYGELFADAEPKRLWTLLERLGGLVLWDMPASVYEQAGQRFRRYADERRRGVLPRRILPDFLIAAHALHHGLALMTSDVTVPRAVFPELELRVP